MSDRSEWSDDDLSDDELPDEDEGDDESAETVPCSCCGESIYEEAEQCPYCGNFVTADTSPWSGRSWSWIALGLLGVVAAIWALMTF